MGAVLPVKVLNKEKDVIFSGTPEEVLKWLRKNYRVRKDIVWVKPGSGHRMFAPYSFLQRDLRVKISLVNKATADKIEKCEAGIADEVYDWYVFQSIPGVYGIQTPKGFVDWWSDLAMKKKILFLESMPQHKMVNRYGR